MASVICEDFVMLGKTVPEPNSDGRVFVCSAGVSTELRSLVRIYPLARHVAPKRWSINCVPLERNPRDSRPESWKIAGDRSLSAHNQINREFQLIGELPRIHRADLLRKYVVDSIRDANQRRISLAVIHPKETPRLRFDFNPGSPESPQLCLFDDIQGQSTEGAKRFPFIPRLEFRDEDSHHSLTLRDWGCFEFMRKYGDDHRQELGKALHLSPDCSLFVGNLNHHRTGWLVISVLHGLREDQGQLPLLEAV